MCRLLLAAIHYNENCDREVVEETDDTGVSHPKLRVEYVKWMQGRGKAKVVRCQPTKGKFTFRILLMTAVYRIYDMITNVSPA